MVAHTHSFSQPLERLRQEYFLSPGAQSQLQVTQSFLKIFSKYHVVQPQKTHEKTIYVDTKFKERFLRKTTNHMVASSGMQSFSGKMSCSLSSDKLFLLSFLREKIFLMLLPASFVDSISIVMKKERVECYLQTLIFRMFSYKFKMIKMGEHCQESLRLKFCLLL